MVTIRIFTITGEAFKNIKSPKSHSVRGSLLTVVFAQSDGTLSTLKTTFPFVVEDDSKAD